MNEKQEIASTSDLEKKWESIYERRMHTIRADSSDKEYWSLRAGDFFDNRSTNDFEYGRKVLEALWGRALGTDSRVLDVGAGPGTLVIPFARKVRHIDALEPAPGMVERIRKNAELKGIGNYGVIEKTWQEADTEVLAGDYDLVISSLVLWVFPDVWHQIQRMEQASRAYCCVVTGAGSNRNNNDEDILRKRIMGDLEYSWTANAEYPLIHDLIKSKGRQVSVDIFEYTSERTVENKVRHLRLFFERCMQVTDDMEEVIREHYMSRSRDGKVREPGTAAVILWPVPQ